MDKASREYWAELHHDGATWCLSLFSKDEANALAKFVSMKASLCLID
jgi:hypothetical protein